MHDNCNGPWRSQTSDYLSFSLWTLLGQHCNFYDVLKMFVIQSLQLNPNSVTASSQPLYSGFTAWCRNGKDWLSILKHVLEGVPVIYIILDVDVVGHVMQYNTFATTRLLELFTQFIHPATVKIVVSQTTVNEGYARRNLDSEVWRKENLDSIGRERKTDFARSIDTRRLKRLRRM